MKKLFALILLAGAFTNAHAGENVARLTLSDAIKTAVEKNLDLRAEIYSVAQFEADVQRSRAIYDPSLTLQTAYNFSPIAVATTSILPASAPGSSNPSSGDGNVQTDIQTVGLNSSLSQLLWTGGTIAAVFNNTYTNTTFANAPMPGSFLSSYWQTNAGFTFTQPLLKNFGRENTELNITVSRLSKYASMEHFNNRLTAIVSQVRTEYFKLYSLREALQVRKVSLDLARKILNDTRARVKAGILPSMEILNAEFGVSSREKDLIDAEKLVQDQVDVLRLLLQLPVGIDIVVVDVPQRDRFEADETEKIRQALNRYDIREQKNNLEIAELQTRINRNRILPDLSLSATTFLTSLDSTYLRTIEKVPTWSVGLNLTYPIGNNAAESEYRKSRLKVEQTAIQIKALEESAANDVRAAIRAIKSSYKQIDVTDRGRAFAEDRLRSFIRKNEVGLATTKDVLDAETDLINATNNQIQALVDYNNAITNLWTVTGELIKQVGILVVEDDADRLYKSVR